MVNDKKDKRKLSNWLDGDTFALKVKSEEYPEYNDQYIILINTVMNKDGWKKSRTTNFFRAKITTNKRILKTKEEIDSLEYIKTGWCGYPSEHSRFPEETKNIKPDEYHLIYKYIFKIHSPKYKIPEELIYIGNYDLKLPENEYIPISEYCGIMYTDWIDVCGEKIQNELVNYYNCFNLKTIPVFTEEIQKDFLEKEKEEIEFYRYLKRLGDAIDGPNGEEILKSMGIDIEKERKHMKKDSLTYVGGDKKG